MLDFLQNGNLLTIALVFAVTTLLSCGFMLGWIRTNPLRDRLNPRGENGAPAAPDKGFVHQILELLSRNPALGKLSMPDGDWQESDLRKQFIRAGLRHEWAPAWFFAAKTTLTLSGALVVIFWMLVDTAAWDMTSQIFLVLSGAAVGYYLPNFYLRQRLAARRDALVANFPDALDLMIICVEAGLGLDAAMQRVAQDIHIQSPEIAEELALVNLELRAGATRARALNNLVLRTGLDEVSVFVTMLMQAERFGGSIAGAIRNHADDLRVRRQQKAEEKAAQIALKLMLPLVFAIFPALFIVLLGPAVINIMKSGFISG